METIGALVYFGSIIAALPAFLALGTLAVVRIRGWRRLAPLVPAVYIGWILIGEFAPVLLQAQQMEPSDLRRLLYERWSAVSRPALHASAAVLALLVLEELRRRIGRRS